MKELLSLLPRPSHYIGTEEGSVHKEPASVRLHCALAFPDLYEVGMSYLGHKILYTILNNREDIFAERVYAPCRETGRLLREHGVSLATLESDTDIVKTHMFAFAITHELCFTNVLYMLELSGIPLRAADRGDDLFRWPLIVAGGGCAIASEPLAPFMDLMLLGEGEEMVPELCDLVIKAREEGWSRSRLIEEAVNIPGVYAPSLYTHDANGVLTPLRGVSRHQDRLGQGNALTKEQHEEDVAFIREVGANTVRLAHYQHSPYFYDACDRAGLVVWAEIPFILSLIHI